MDSEMVSAIRGLTTVNYEAFTGAIALFVIVVIMVIVKVSFQSIKTTSGKPLFGDVGQVIKVSWNLLLGAIYLGFVVACWISNPILGVIVMPLPWVRLKRQA